MGLYKGKSMSTSQKITWTIVSIIFGIVAATYTFILIWGFVSGTKTGTEFGTMKDPFELPKQWHFENYIRAFSAFRLLLDVLAKARFVREARNAEKTARADAISVLCGGSSFLINTCCRKHGSECGLFLFVGEKIQKRVPQS